MLLLTGNIRENVKITELLQLNRITCNCGKEGRDNNNIQIPCHWFYFEMVTRNELKVERFILDHHLHVDTNDSPLLHYGPSPHT